MAITVEAVYENGVLKLSQPLPLKEQEKVQIHIETPVSVQAAMDAVQRSYGLLGWKGSSEELDRLLHEIEFDEDEAS
jgi:predicted DNA-binding antitoxin AbrB/MazE fold protein